MSRNYDAIGSEYLVSLILWPVSRCAGAVKMECSKVGGGVLGGLCVRQGNGAGKGSLRNGALIRLLRSYISYYRQARRVINPSAWD